MARLAEIIGPAPSELDINSHLRKLSKERDRVRDSLSALRQQPTTSRRKPAKRTKKVAVTKRVKALEQSGKSPNRYRSTNASGACQKGEC
jgi:hypothetical protein